MADESCPTGKSSDRNCLIVTLSAKVAQSTRRGVPLVYFSAKDLSNVKPCCTLPNNSSLLPWGVPEQPEDPL